MPSAKINAYSRVALCPLPVCRSDSIFIFSCIGTPVVTKSCKSNDENPLAEGVARLKIDRPAAFPRTEGNKAGRAGEGQASTGARDAWIPSLSMVTWERGNCIGCLSGVVRSEYDVEFDRQAKLVAHVFVFDK